MFVKEDPTKEVGKITYQATQLLDCPRYTTIASLPVGIDRIKMKVRLQLRPLQPVYEARLRSNLDSDGSAAMDRVTSMPVEMSPRKPSPRTPRTSGSRMMHVNSGTRSWKLDAKTRDRAATIAEDWCSASSGSDSDECYDLP